LENVSTILDSIMEDRTPGKALDMAKLDACVEESDEFENSFDLRDAGIHPKYEHSTYQADPYYGTVGWFKFLKGKGKKTVAAGRNDDGAYECLVLKKVNKSGNEVSEFAINIPVGMIPVLQLVFQKILIIRDNYMEARDAKKKIGDKK
jgi:hypothetical protein